MILFRSKPTLFFAATLLSYLAQGQTHASSATHPNIIVILADDFGYGSLGSYGAKGLKTPHLDRLAQEGRRFTQAYAPGSVCSPTRYGLMTGRYFWRTNIKDGEVLPPDAPLHIETTRLTLASLCRSQGYRTAMFGKWHLGFTAGNITDWSQALAPGPRQIGFEHFYGMVANLPAVPHGFVENDEANAPFVSEPSPTAKPSTTTEAAPTVRNTWKVDHVMATLTAKTNQWIEANHQQPFFVYYAPNAVHEPIQPNPRFTGSPYGKYGDFINELDDSVGQILATLDRLKLTENTLIIFTSDNGAVIDSRNENSATAMKAGLSLNGALRGGKHSEWEGGFREPFIVRWPGHVPAGTVSEQVICLTDLLATFAGVLHAPLPRGQAEDSFNVLRAFTEAKPGSPVREAVILQSADATYDVRQGDWKFIERADAPAFATDRNKRTIDAAAHKKSAGLSTDELYQLASDPAETSDVHAKHLERAATLKKLLVNARDRGFTRPDAGP